ncbi:hypothetical protein D3C81_1578340 [compost metagenome]|uniref:hypothetical protein n=1 Tax=Pseudomonas sp. PDM27 TaxID=2854769 RepID=UPI000FA59279|nr:hypothetical protein [Pseudomonas sp. PDM27]
MHSHIAPSNTLDVVTRFGQSQNISCLTMSSHDIAELIVSSHDNVWKTVRALATKGVASSNDTPYKVTALKPDPEASIQRAAFDPMVTPKGLVRLAELLQETM